jgi:hypothetical protein
MQTTNPVFVRSTMYIFRSLRASVLCERGSLPHEYGSLPRPAKSAGLRNDMLFWVLLTKTE